MPDCPRWRSSEQFLGLASFLILVRRVSSDGPRCVPGAEGTSLRLGRGIQGPVGLGARGPGCLSGKGQQPQREDLPLRQKWSREGVQKAWEKAVEGLHWQRRQIGAASWPADWGSSRARGQAGPFRFLLWTGGVCVGNCFLSATLRQQCCCFSFLEETAAASCQDPRGM